MFRSFCETLGKHEHLIDMCVDVYDKNYDPVVGPLKLTPVYGVLSKPRCNVIGETDYYMNLGNIDDSFRFLNNNYDKKTMLIKYELHYCKEYSNTQNLLILLMKTGSNSHFRYVKMCFTSEMKSVERSRKIVYETEVK